MIMLLRFSRRSILAPGLADTAEVFTPLGDCKTAAQASFFWTSVPSERGLQEGGLDAWQSLLKVTGCMFSLATLLKYCQCFC